MLTETRFCFGLVLIEVSFKTRTRYADRYVDIPCVSLSVANESFVPGYYLVGRRGPDPGSFP